MLLIDSAVRVTLIAAAVALILWMMRVKTASALHAVWTGVVVLMMLLPTWVAWGPKARFPVLPGQATTTIEPVGYVPPPLPAGLEERPASPVREDGGYPLRENAITVVYLLGVCALLLRLAIGTVRASRLKSAVVPVTVGLLRPRIILPDSSHAWPQAQLDAVLTHEREHVRRRDPLFQWIALLNRAIFWFHPLAWWLERKLSGLAEEACDAAVLSRGHDAREYSVWLLDLAHSVERTGLRVEGMAMPGVGLKHRIRRMLSGVPIPRISRPRMACTLAVCAGAAAILAAGTLVRAQVALPAFEVASVKANTRTEPGGTRFDPIGVNIRSARLLDVISTAYQIPYSRVSTEDPRTRDLFNARYDIVAKAGHEVPKDQILAMLQTLLAERFKLTLHHEATVQPVYKLTVAKNGPKFQESKNPRTQDQNCSFPKCMAFNNIEMWVFAATLTGRMDRPVLDLTGLKGAYDITLRLDILEGLSSDDPEIKRKITDWSSSSIFTDIQKQLGLKLESDRAPVDILVIDHVEMPSEN